MEIRSIVSRLFALGARSQVAPPVRGRIVLSNQIAAIVVVIALVAIGTGEGQREQPLLYGNLLLVLSAASVPLLNATGHTTASRLVLVVCPPFALVGAGLLENASRLAYVLALPYALIAMSLLPLLLFHDQSERVPRRVGVVLIGAMLLGHDWLLAGTLADDDRGLLEGIIGEAKSAQMILWALLIASVQFALHADAYGAPEQENSSGSDAAG